MTPEQRHQLTTWVDRVTGTLGLDGVDVPVEELLALAGAVSAGVARPAVPVTAYVAGYLAGARAQGAGTPGAARAVQDVLAVVPAPSAGGAEHGPRRPD